MTCKACGYDDHNGKMQTIKVDDKIVKYRDLPFLKLYNIAIASKSKYGDYGTTLPAYACPKCGTIKMEV